MSGKCSGRAKEQGVWKPRCQRVPSINQGWPGRSGARGAGRQKAAPPAGARGAAKLRGALRFKTSGALIGVWDVDYAIVRLDICEM